ncbi:uncharacterized protein [Blastocystis hominis]|uniref:Exocyst complex component EXOC6/Sec15 N-terminal domain-containing protein n=1 Tax=Blastocystis hominis TaxID=12968 RepID=D8M6S9_BLAHO|nr:uncharacterized protein [Blastocystis hominis]CBK23497.2 unnamed protein product [Blastocystis hominis]|eukprot:XP_012897545.1 uncharacterized protein [Blastocystis hominis]
MLKTVLQRGWTEPFKKSLKSYIDDHKQSLQDNCNKNYIQFCNNMDQILDMRRDVKALRDNVTSFHDDVSFKGTRILRETERYISYQNTLEHVGKASDDLVIFDSLLTMVERVNKLVDEKNYYLALKTLDTLKVSLKTVPECRLTRNLQAFIQPQTDKIISLCRSAFLKWCGEIRSVCRTIGEASMIRAFNRKHKDADAKLKKEGVEDILEKVDLSVVFEYQHVFEHASRLSEFKRLYIENRETQCDFDLLASRNLKALETSKFVSLLNGLLYASIGFFLVEDNLQRGSLLYNDSTHMQDLFNEQLKTLKEALLYHLRSISDVDTLLSIEVRFFSSLLILSRLPCGPTPT